MGTVSYTFTGKHTHRQVEGNYLEQARRTEDSFCWRRGHRAHEVQGSLPGAASLLDREELGFVGKTIRRRRANEPIRCGAVANVIRPG
jgi:hypothetical protein